MPNAEISTKSILECFEDKMGDNVPETCTRNNTERMTCSQVVCLLKKWRDVAALSLQNCHSSHDDFFLRFLKNKCRKICIIQKKVVPLHQRCKTDEKVANFASVEQLLKTEENDSRTRLKSYIQNKFKLCQKSFMTFIRTRTSTTRPTASISVVSFTPRR